MINNNQINAKNEISKCIDIIKKKYNLKNDFCTYRFIKNEQTDELRIVMRFNFDYFNNNDNRFVDILFDKNLKVKYFEVIKYKYPDLLIESKAKELNNIIINPKLSTKINYSEAYRIIINSIDNSLIFKNGSFKARMFNLKNYKFKCKNFKNNYILNNSTYSTIMLENPENKKYYRFNLMDLQLYSISDSLENYFKNVVLKFDKSVLKGRIATVIKKNKQGLNYNTKGLVTNIFDIGSKKYCEININDKIYIIPKNKLICKYIDNKKENKNEEEKNNNSKREALNEFETFETYSWRFINFGTGRRGTTISPFTVFSDNFSSTSNVENPPSSNTESPS